MTRKQPRATVVPRHPSHHLHHVFSVENILHHRKDYDREQPLITQTPHLTKNMSSPETLDLTHRTLHRWRPTHRPPTSTARPPPPTTPSLPPPRKALVRPPNAPRATTEVHLPQQDHHLLYPPKNLSHHRNNQQHLHRTPQSLSPRNHMSSQCTPAQRHPSIAANSALAPERPNRLLHANADGVTPTHHIHQSLPSAATPTMMMMKVTRT